MDLPIESQGNAYIKFIKMQTMDEPLLNLKNNNVEAVHLVRHTFE